MGIFNNLFKKPEDKLKEYLLKSIENAGINNNTMKNDPLLSAMGFIDAISAKKRSLLMEVSALSNQYGISAQNIKNYINNFTSSMQ